MMLNKLKNRLLELKPPVKKGMFDTWIDVLRNSLRVLTISIAVYAWTLPNSWLSTIANLSMLLFSWICNYLALHYLFKYEKSLIQKEDDSTTLSNNGEKHE